MQFGRITKFLGENVARVLFLSALLIVPCFWHKSVEAGDLPSHTYNAWLAHLIAEGHAPGLYIQPRWNNIVIDWALENLGALLGFTVAERIVVVVCVLIFFWGAFTLISAVSLRPPWYLVPAIAMVTYGWTFYAGFMNFYLSLGLGFFAAAVVWRGNRRHWWIVGALAVVVLIAHPLGLICLIGLAAYLRLSDVLKGRMRWALFPSALLVVARIHYYVMQLPSTYWHNKDFFVMNGADQLVLFQAHYAKLAVEVVIFASVCFVYGVAREWNTNDNKWSFRAPLELWGVLLFIAAMIPEVMLLSSYPMPFSLAISRLTSVTAVLGLCVFASVKPRLLHFVGFAVSAAIFFLWTYQDTGLLNDMERQAEKLVSALPYGRRVTETIIMRPDSRLWFANHIVDRACIEKCFTYENYQPAAKVFRVRVKPGSPIVTDSTKDSSDMEMGYYKVGPKDLPMNQIYQCSEKDLSKLCMRELSAGEENGRVGYRPASLFR